MGWPRMCSLPRSVCTCISLRWSRLCSQGIGRRPCIWRSEERPPTWVDFASHWSQGHLRTKVQVQRQVIETAHWSLLPWSGMRPHNLWTGRSHLQGPREHWWKGTTVEESHSWSIERLWALAAQYNLYRPMVAQESRRKALGWTSCPGPRKVAILSVSTHWRWAPWRRSQEGMNPDIGEGTGERIAESCSWSTTKSRAPGA